MELLGLLSKRITKEGKATRKQKMFYRHKYLYIKFSTTEFHECWGRDLSSQVQKVTIEAFENPW